MLVLTTIWTSADILRMQRFWVPVRGWEAISSNALTWVTRLLPPALFGIILLISCALKKAITSTR
jgi:hypothetical protein